MTDPTPDEVTTSPFELVRVVYLLISKNSYEPRVWTYTKLVETDWPALLRLLAELATALLTLAALLDALAPAPPPP